MNIQEQRAALMDTLVDMLDGLVSSISIDAQLVRPAAGKVAVFIEPPTVEWPSWGPPEPVWTLDVIAGTPAAVTRAEEAWAASKGRFSRLATSGAFHSPLMAPAQAPFADYLAKVEFREPVVPVIGNVHAAPLDVAGAREELVAHLVSPVQFEASVAKLQAVGAKMFAEVGFGGVLANLVKRIDRSAPRAAIQDRPSFDAFVEEFGKE